MRRIPGARRIAGRGGRFASGVKTSPGQFFWSRDVAKATLFVDGPGFA